MARFRKTDVRMWRDERFRRLTFAPPSGRECWQFLLTNPHTSNIPGVYAAYPETLAAELRWPVKGFLEVFGECFREGLAKADWKAGLIFIPGAIKYNRPENPNVIKSWDVTWDELPECDLKTEAYQHLKEYLKGYRESFAKAFEEACGKGMANQEQEQEQEQDTESGLGSESKEPLTLIPSDSDLSFDFERLYRLYPRHEGKADGMRHLTAQIKTLVDFAKFERAMGFYAEMVRIEKREPSKVLLWSTFCCSRWMDYVDGIPRQLSSGSAPAKNEPPRPKLGAAEDVLRAAGIEIGKATR